jgi:hypothetical protein
MMAGVFKNIYSQKAMLYILQNKFVGWGVVRESSNLFI